MGRMIEAVGKQRRWVGHCCWDGTRTRKRRVRHLIAKLRIAGQRRRWAGPRTVIETWTWRQRAREKSSGAPCRLIRGRSASISSGYSTKSPWI